MGGGTTWLVALCGSPCPACSRGINPRLRGRWAGAAARTAKRGSGRLEPAIRCAFPGKPGKPRVFAPDIGSPRKNAEIGRRGLLRFGETRHKGEIGDQPRRKIARHHLFHNGRCPILITKDGKAKRARSQRGNITLIEQGAQGILETGTVARDGKAQGEPPPRFGSAGIKLKRTAVAGLSRRLIADQIIGQRPLRFDLVDGNARRQSLGELIKRLWTVARPQCHLRKAQQGARIVGVKRCRPREKARGSIKIIDRQRSFARLQQCAEVTLIARQLHQRTVEALHLV